MAVTDRREPGGSIALVGDLHSAWEPEDIGYFNRSEYEIALFTGDLGRSRSQDGRRIARSLSHLRQQVLVMPGNNDVEEFPHIKAELTYRRARAALLLDAEGEAEATPDHGTARLCGYSLHPLQLNGFELTLLAARPFSMGGPELAFPQALERSFGVRSMAESIERLRGLIDRAATRELVVLAHNGPTGLGGEPTDLWGRDFDPDAGDWGDPDLRAALDYARERGKRVLAVLAGHMHWGLRERPGVVRSWQLQREGCLYVNAARVPRVFAEGSASMRQHVRLQLTAAGASAEEVVAVDRDHDASRTPSRQT
jgi:uncharacterized protein (TIGR04168 family)